MANAVNGVGQIAGTHLKDGKRQPCTWTRVGTTWLLTDLSAYAAGFTINNVADINDSGQLVANGVWESGGRAPALFKNGVLHNLNECLPQLPAGFGWMPNGVRGINNQGQIVGLADSTTTVGYSAGLVMDTQAVTYSYMSPVAQLPIKDLSTTTKVMTLTGNATILDLDVKLELLHWRFSDLKIELIGPDNAKRVLCNAGGLSGMGVKTVVFDDDGSAGSMRPVNSLSYYDRRSTPGTWKVLVTDTKKSQTGSFLSYSLIVVPGL